MPRRLAITIAGAVSLGSYEAGVLYEVLDAIDQHNATPGITDNDKIVIDVMSGASAGGMTATILSQKLLYNALDFKGPYDNPLYNCWVERIDLKGLQNTGDDEPALHSIFSSNLINQIAEEMLLARYDLNPRPAAQPHSAVGDTIRLGLAVTNLNGVDYGFEVTPGGKFIYSRYGDQFTRTIVSADADNKPFWTPLANAAVACGAFPVAFRTKELERSAAKESGDYPSQNLQPWDSDPYTFTYSDGGIIQNQPLGVAKNLVDEIDEHLNQDSRYYLFISPNAKDSSANDNFHENNADYIHLIKRLLGVVIGQSEFHDWINAEELNKKVALLDTRASQLKDVILAGKIDVPSLENTASTFLKLLFPDGSHNPPGSTGPETLQQAKDRIAHQFAQEIAALGGEVTDQGAAFRDSILAFESVAGLGARDTMQIYGVTAMDSELAGAGLQAFLGFFDQVYRDHDYDTGREHARTFFQKGAEQQPNGLCPLLFKSIQKPMRTIDHRLDGLKLSHVSAADLAQFKTGLKNRLNQAIKELVGNWSFIADPVADRLLSLALDQLIAKM